MSNSERRERSQEDRHHSIRSLVSVTAWNGPLDVLPVDYQILICHE
jgi:hypothetical protein